MNRSSAHWLSNTAWLSVSLCLLLGIWQAAASAMDNAVLMPGPFAVLRDFVAMIPDGTLGRDVLASLQRVFTGFFAAAALAVPLALLMAYVAPLRKLLSPLISLLRPIPPIAWIPLAILWFGIGDKPSYFITTIAAFFPIFINSLAGGLAVEPRHLFAARFLGAGRCRIIRTVYLPSALPMIWTGLRIGLGQSWMAVVTAELIAAQSGLGYMIQINRINLETSLVLAGMVTIGVLGALMTLALGYAERFVLPWQRP